MKKLLLIAITSLFSFGVDAQQRELNCTEQAVSFKINILSAGYGHAAKIGRWDFSQLPSGFRFVNVAMQKKTRHDTITLAPSNSYVNYFPTNIVVPKKMTFLYPKVSSLTGKFTSTAYDYIKLLPMANISTLAPVLN